MVQKDRLIQSFIELVRIDSETGKETAIAEALKQRFAQLGLEVKEDGAAAKTGHGAGNLFVTLPAAGTEGGRAIFFTSHMDTVAPGIGIRPQLDTDGYIRSDGTTVLGSDDKAGIAVMLEALQVITERQLPHGPLQFIITVGEESGLVGARAIEPGQVKAEFGFALDSNGSIGDIAVAAPSQAKITMRVLGKSAHAGVNPEDGISAIQVAGKAIARMPLGRIDHETTANIGRFEGGGATNIVCESATLIAEARSLDSGKLDRQLAAMRAALESACAEFGAEAEFHSELIYPSYRHDSSDEVVAIAASAVRRIGAEPRTFHSGGGSDANIFNGLGVPTVNLAVGYQHIHTVKEQIKADDLVQLAELVLTIIDEARQ